MASKRRNMFQKNKTQETMENAVYCLDQIQILKQAKNSVSTRERTRADGIPGRWSLNNENSKGVPVKDVWEAESKPGGPLTEWREKEEKGEGGSGLSWERPGAKAEQKSITASAFILLPGDTGQQKGVEKRWEDFLTPRYQYPAAEDDEQTKLIRSQQPHVPPSTQV
ncbi:hypothetical protein AAG570_004844 [Ranatra chinensis]|uniref:Uncharacterized protein n=1 Tax=Ranatra chinensis TaxID=642074 RepID=A0ABD0YKG0_9HEMI